MIGDLSGIRPHDLLRISGPAALPEEAPQWVAHALDSTPWVVVRRARAPDGMIAVGVRGRGRSQRHGAYVAAADVREVVAPEKLTHVSAPGRDIPALAALSSLRPFLDHTGLRWGPTGSVGFELATGRATAGPDSDLDLVVRADGVGETRAGLVVLDDAFRSSAVRVDCQIETPCGAVALAELVGDGREVMVRTSDGPRLAVRTAVS